MKIKNKKFLFSVLLLVTVAFFGNIRVIQVRAADMGENPPIQVPSNSAPLPDSLSTRGPGTQEENEESINKGCTVLVNNQPMHVENGQLVSGEGNCPDDSASARIVYTPMEAIPGFGYPSEFPAYIISIFKFGIWIAGISAVIMIMVGGYIYMTSAGNNAQMEKAKGIITDAILGLILALTSWLLLYIINPHLTQIEEFRDPIDPKVLDDLGNKIKLKNTGGDNLDLEHFGQDQK